MWYKVGVSTTPPKSDLGRRLGLDPKVLKRLDKLARKNERTIAAEIRIAISLHLALANETEGRTDGRV